MKEKNELFQERKLLTIFARFNYKNNETKEKNKTKT